MRVPGEGIDLTQGASPGLQGSCQKLAPRTEPARGEGPSTPRAWIQASAESATANSPATRALSLSSATFDLTTSPPVTMRM